MKNKMTTGVKILLTLSVLIVASAMLMSYLPVHNEEKIYDNVIRLHVIANSDSDADQKLKLKVRDAVLAVVSSLPAAADKSDAEENIRGAEGLISSAAKRVLNENGSDDDVSIFFDTESYPVRYYEDYSLPAGKYTSLRVVIGEGQGHNWWCVLFPPLCAAAGKTDDEGEFLEVGFTGEQYRVIKNDTGSKYKVRFKILEILSDVFGFEY